MLLVICSGLATLAGVCFIAYCIWDHFVDFSDNAIPLVIKILIPGIVTGMPFVIFLQALNQYKHPEVWARQMAQQHAARVAADAPHLVTSNDDDGCQVYRFRDSGMTHYYTKCPRADVTTTTQRDVVTHYNCGPRGQQCERHHTEQSEISTQ